MNRRFSVVIVISVVLLAAGPAAAAAQAAAAALATVAARATVAAGPAAAAAQSGGASFPTVSLSARTAGGGFNGRFKVRRFGVRPTGLAAFGRLTGRVRDSRFPSIQGLRNRPFSFAVTLAPVTGVPTCARLAVVLAPRTAPLVGLTATFAPRTVVLRPRRGTGPSTSELLCGASAAVAANAPPTVTVHLLNALRLQYA
jgi:hypothetical protein